MSWLPRIIKAPGAFKRFMDAFNAAMAAIEKRTNFTSTDGTVSITVADNNVDFSISSANTGPDPASATATGGTALPDGITTNDLLRWDAPTSSWVIVPAPSTSGVWALTVEAGVMGWTEGDDCDEEE